LLHKTINDMKKLSYVFYLVLAFVFIGCENKPKDCKTYRYNIDVCNNCFGAWFYTDSIRWENGILIAKDDDGKNRMLRPLEIEEGKFEVCK
jgi:hypothetical protein